MSIILIDGASITVLPPRVRALETHNPDQCSGRPCVVHAPTEHAMRAWPLHWRADRGIFERLCPHGIGHPDPDQRDYWREQAERGDILDECGAAGDVVARTPDDHVSAMSVHGCDGCCR